MKSTEPLFVNFHGSYEGKRVSWLNYLRNQFKSQGLEFYTPEFPADDWDEVTRLGSSKAKITQSLQAWLKLFEKYLPRIKKHAKLRFIGHSLGPLFALYVVDKYEIQVERAVFVAPFLEDLKVDWQIYESNKTFYKKDFDFAKLRRLIPESTVLYSDDDPYVKTKYSKDFASKLGSKTILCKGMGHFNKIEEFPLLYKLCVK